MKKLSLLLVAAAFMALLTPVAFAQLATLKGSVKGTDGKPLVGATVEMVDTSNGRKYQIKADKHGNIFSLGIAGGTYNITILGPDGKTLYQYTNYHIQSGSEADLDIDLQKEMQRQQASMSTEQKKAIEQQNQERQKIKNLNQMLAQAKAATEAGNYAEAKQLMTQATQLDPTHEVLWFNLAEAERNEAMKSADPAAKKAELQQAVDNYKKAAQITPNTKTDILGAIYNQMGEAYFRMGDVESAAKAYDQAASADLPNAGKYYYNEGAILTNAGKYDEAITAFDKAIQADPTKADAYYQKGVNLLGKATTKPDGTMVVPPGTADAFNKYLELAPEGQYAAAAKQMLSMIGAKVETTFGKGKSRKKR